ncbi:hypothetical protein AMTRI_Chr01g132660 [Amborella trichopoda]|uniref:Peptide N-acetyl-beta-D-glucosaminyl asparaginase amidase A N-terminal domain-containing protein n=1 Tax=Amborella trichopoda TaxID=13333 RepID=W1Q0Y2_AMBTC|nr:peptide-N4-(N-acetyl-beta-glucosaminyl)asparagine amidase A [Amborella trichopoda]ERN13870.1 hypothetical protein AMTR_s00021p00030140 [Amborella trichopoda]|eukprot:XP_006852403.1 peptide-N4-(N-acetyl-beta-glucosaminyl)asparagine amidase A [Amborella trichopoda]
MATFSLMALVSFLMFLLTQPLSSNANLYKTSLFRSKLPEPIHDAPTVYFEVTKDIQTHHKKPCSSLLVLQHDFGQTYGKPPVTASYNPPKTCSNWSKVVLEWTSTCKGRQFDRIFGVWLGGVEILRSCTAEPRATGIIWTVKKDITRYSSLLKQPNNLSIYLGNLVDNTYTGIYHANVTIHFYPPETHGGLDKIHSKRLNYASSFDSLADLILPISRSPPLNDGLWFLVENSTDVQGKEFKIPPNAYRAVLEVYVSFHSSDEFWYGNPPNNYIEANNLTATPGNGPFREVVVSLDGRVVGAVWPFTVVYTGGVNPLLWRPITGIGSFDLPSYDIDITPFLGSILDEKYHSLGFGVTNGLSVWFIDANLHLWLDSRSEKTKGKLFKYKAPAIKPTLVSDFKGLNGVFWTNADRYIDSTGWVKSSYGKITTHVFHGFTYMNEMVFGKNGSMQIVNQKIGNNYGVYAMVPSANIYYMQSFRSFPLYLYTDTVDQDNDTYSFVSNISLGFNTDSFKGARFGFFVEYLRNLQEGEGKMLVKGNLVTSGIASTEQAYKYDSSEGCYFRTVGSKNYTILFDQSGNICGKKLPSYSAVGFGSMPYHLARRAFLASHSHSPHGD